MIIHDNFFDEIINSLIKNTYNFYFNLNDLPDIDNYNLDIRQHGKFQKLFKELNAKQRNCLYWFELDTPEICQNLKNKLDDSRENLKISERTVPVKNKNFDSSVLYVGIRRGGVRKRDGLSTLAGRIIIHLGYYPAGSTQGLQLVHWAVGTGYNIKLRVIQFEENFPNAYLEAFEKIIAHKLRPLCGKH